MSIETLSIKVYVIFDNTGGFAAYKSYDTAFAGFFDTKAQAAKVLKALISEYGTDREWEIIECELYIPNKWGYVEK
jgi:hypothetical protein